MQAQKIDWQQQSAVRWVGGNYSILLLPSNQYRTERFSVYRFGKFIGQHVTIEEAKEQCEFFEGAQ